MFNNPSALMMAMDNVGGGGAMGGMGMNTMDNQIGGAMGGMGMNMLENQMGGARGR